MSVPARKNVKSNGPVRVDVVGQVYNTTVMGEAIPATPDGVSSALDSLASISDNTHILTNEIFCYLGIDEAPLESRPERTGIAGVIRQRNDVLAAANGTLRNDIDEHPSSSDALHPEGIA